MTDIRVFVKLLIIMMIVSFSAIAITAAVIYREALVERGRLLDEVAARYRRSIAAVIEFQELHAVKYHSPALKVDKQYALKRLAKMAQRASKASGLRGDIEIVIGALRENQIWFLSDLNVPDEKKKREPIFLGSDLAIPMQLALQGKEGNIKEYDYNGDRVFAAYTYYEKAGVGIVVKSHIAAIHRRFIKSVTLAIVPAVLLVLVGVLYFWRTTSGITKQLRKDNERYRRVVDEVNQANKKTIESEGRLQCFFDAAFEGIAVTESGVFIDSNKRFATMFGYTVEEIIGMKVASLVHPDDYDLVVKNISEEYIESYEHRTMHKDGSIVFVEVHGQMTEFQGRKVRITAIHDLTERIKTVAAIKELADQKRQSSKMEAVGNFAAGITHDFNNALQPIIGNCDLLLLKMGKHKKQSVECEKICEGCQGNVLKIINAAETAQLLVRRIQTFTRKEAMAEEKTLLNVETCVTEAFEFLRSITPTSIDMDMNLEPGLAHVTTTDVMIRQILMNLVKNSAHAIGSDGGRICIDVSNDFIHVERFNIKPGPYVKIEVEDNGCGMPEEVLERALDPYYTTKEEEGTGLGLAVVQGILDANGGLIHLQSAQDMGTKVTLYLPAATGDEKAIVNCKLDEPITLGDGQRILFVDDDENIVQMARNILVSLKYDVTCFIDSREALEEFRLNPTAYDILMTDLTMPKMTGNRLIQEIKKINPEIKVILSSGLGSNGKYHAESDTRMIDKYMQKPITRCEYAKVLSDLFLAKD